MSKEILGLTKKNLINASAAHITGGGLIENIIKINTRII